MSDIKIALTNALEPHRLDEDGLNSIKNHHWDYWCFPESPILTDSEIGKHFSEIDQEILNNASFVKNLPKDYSASGIIDLTGHWIDLQDFGWKMINEPSPENEIALQKWMNDQKKIFDENSEYICVQVIIHY